MNLERLRLFFLGNFRGSASKNSSRCEERREVSGVTEWGALSRKSEQPAHEHHKQGRRVWACDYHLRRARWRGGPWPSSSSVLDPAEDTLTLSFITEATRVDSAGNFMTREHLEMLVRTCNGRTSPAAAAAVTTGIATSSPLSY
jgi:hypothetical protein